MTSKPGVEGVVTAITRIMIAIPGIEWVFIAIPGIEGNTIPEVELEMTPNVEFRKLWFIYTSVRGTGDWFTWNKGSSLYPEWRRICCLQPGWSPPRGAGGHSAGSSTALQPLQETMDSNQVLKNAYLDMNKWTGLLCWILGPNEMYAYYSTPCSKL